MIANAVIKATMPTLVEICIDSNGEDKKDKNCRTTGYHSSCFDLFTTVGSCDKRP